MRYLVLSFSLVLCFVSNNVQASDISGIEFHKPLAKAALSDEDCNEILKMYSEMQEVYSSCKLDYVPVTKLKVQIGLHAGIDTVEVVDGNSVFKTDIDLPKNAGLNMVRDLNIELPMSEICSVYEKFGVLQLRPFKGENLLIGCGNGPVGQRYIGDHDHLHDTYDTINPDMSMNPTIIAAFGNNCLRELLPCKYKKVTYECIDPLSSPRALEEFKYHFSMAKVYDVSFVEGYTENPFESIEKMIEIYQASWKEYRDELLK